MKEESLLLLSDLQKLINQVVLIDYTIIILGGIIHGYGQHMVQAEGEEQPLQCSVDKGGQHRRGGGGVGNPHAEGVDAGLNHRPDNGQHQ